MFAERRLITAKRRASAHHRLNMHGPGIDRYANIVIETGSIKSVRQTINESLKQAFKQENTPVESFPIHQRDP